MTCNSCEHWNEDTRDCMYYKKKSPVVYKALLSYERDETGKAVFREINNAENICSHFRDKNNVINNNIYKNKDTHSKYWENAGIITANTVDNTIDNNVNNVIDVVDNTGITKDYLDKFSNFKNTKLFPIQDEESENVDDKFDGDDNNAYDYGDWEASRESDVELFNRKLRKVINNCTDIFLKAFPKGDYTTEYDREYNRLYIELRFNEKPDYEDSYEKDEGN